MADAQAHSAWVAKEVVPADGGWIEIWMNETQ